MAFDRKVVRYVEDAVSRGFGDDHITEKLRKAGYTDADIREAISRARPRKNSGIRHRRFRIGWLVWALTSVLLITTIAFLLVDNQADDDSIPTGAVVITDADEYHAYLQRITQLQDQVDRREESIEDALDRAKEAELSVSEKDQLIAELQSYYQDVKEERRETRDALLGLMEFLYGDK